MASDGRILFDPWDLIATRAASLPCTSDGSLKIQTQESTLGDGNQIVQHTCVTFDVALSDYPHIRTPYTVNFNILGCIIDEPDIVLPVYEDVELDLSSDEIAVKWVPLKPFES